MMGMETVQPTGDSGAKKSPVPVSIMQGSEARRQAEPMVRKTTMTQGHFL